MDKTQLPSVCLLMRINNRIAVVYVECLVMHLQEKHLARTPINIAIMFIQTTLFARPSTKMKDENIQNGSLKLDTCFVRQIIIYSALSLRACFPRRFSYTTKIYYKNKKCIPFHLM